MKSERKIKKIIGALLDDLPHLTNEEIKYGLEKILEEMETEKKPKTLTETELTEEVTEIELEAFDLITEMIKEEEVK